MKRSPNPKKFLTSEESRQVAAAIEEAENRTSGEIKLVLVRHCWTDILTKAAQMFKKLNLDKTEQRNCAMIMLVLTNREFLIYGDQGIHEKVGQEFWDDVRDLMRVKFKEGKFGDGLCAGILRIGEKLAQFFPYQAGDKDEISDEIAFEE
ncbi:MAG: TPM domain-containing protein [Candidatus Hydrogenedentota bacterium]|nr:MAG: TPM domain-containing protein [Candidatus Hydrogenedentota bacterium]